MSVGIGRDRGLTEACVLAHSDRKRGMKEKERSWLKDGGNRTSVNWGRMRGSNAGWNGWGECGEECSDEPGEAHGRKRMDAGPRATDGIVLRFVRLKMTQ